MIKPDKLYFGPAGVPHKAKKKDTLTGIETIKELGLNAMELEFVYGVKLNEEVASKAKDLANQYKIILTAHAPYYVNLNSNEESKFKNSIRMVMESAKALYLSGGYSVCVHPGWYQKSSKEEAFERVKNAFKTISRMIKEEGYEVWVRPETMEGKAKFGDLDEVLAVCEGLDYILPCIDFAHLRFRNGWNDSESFKEILNRVEDSLGKEALRNMHIHISGIKMDKAGTHLNLEESDMKWREVLEVLKEYRTLGVLICESPNLEEDTLMLKKYYEEL
ncbi:MAG TPA: TIM barrel protein [Geobacterales bacterium]|nr:TIM barrel protein [Geobacterales bacterium]